MQHRDGVYYDEDGTALDPQPTGALEAARAAATRDAHGTHSLPAGTAADDPTDEELLAEVRGSSVDIFDTAGEETPAPTFRGYIGRRLAAWAAKP